MGMLGSIFMEEDELNMSILKEGIKYIEYIALALLTIPSISIAIVVGLTNVFDFVIIL